MAGVRNSWLYKKKVLSQKDRVFKLSLLRCLRAIKVHSIKSLRKQDFCLEVSEKFSDVANDNGGRIGH
jgi:hypothetical protein